MEALVWIFVMWGWKLIVWVIRERLLHLSGAAELEQQKNIRKLLQPSDSRLLGILRLNPSILRCGFSRTSKREEQAQEKSWLVDFVMILENATDVFLRNQEFSSIGFIDCVLWLYQNLVCSHKDTYMWILVRPECQGYKISCCCFNLFFSWHW